MDWLPAFSWLKVEIDEAYAKGRFDDEQFYDRTIKSLKSINDVIKTPTWFAGSQRTKKALDELYNISLSFKNDNGVKIEKETAKVLYEKTTRLLTDYEYFKKQD